MQTPSQHFVEVAQTPFETTDRLGRRLALRRLGALERLRLFKAAGPALASNPGWIGLATLAVSVTAIDEVPVPAPATEAQIESLVARLGDPGLAAASAALAAAAAADPAPVDAKN